MAGRAAEPREIRAAFERLLSLPRARRADAARRRLEGSPELLAEVLRLLPHADLPEQFLSPPPTFVPDPNRRPRAVPGRLLGGRWRLVREIGSGGQGVVCEARDLAGGERVAVKLLRGLRPATRERIRREAAVLRWLRLPGVVRLLDDGEDRGDFWLAMEFVEGKPFRSKRRAPWGDIERPALGLLEALGRIHGAGVVHGDLKPSNVLVDAAGTATVLDLGLAAHLADAAKEGLWAWRGTPGYAAPECAAGRPPDVRADLYAVGVILFEALTGLHPEDAAPGALRSTDAPPRVRRMLARLVAADRERRPASAAEVLSAISGPRATRRRRPWKERELRVRFSGHDWFHHLREDAAHELFLRTGGRPAAVEAELASWFRAGFARLENGVVAIDRVSLDRIRGLAPSDPSSANARGDDADSPLAAALRSGRGRAVVAASFRSARASLDAGQATRAISALEVGAEVARAIRGRPRLGEMLRLAVEAALNTASLREVDRALWLIQRVGAADRATRSLIAVTKAAALHQSGDSAAAYRMATEQTRRGARSTALLAWWVRAVSARSLSLAVQRRVVAEGAKWSRRDGTSGARSWHLRCQAWLLYREGRCAEAAKLHGLAARTAGSVSERLRGLLDAATASLDGGDAPAAATVAHRVRRVARRLRRPVQEARAHFLIRAAADVTGVAPGPNLASLTAVDGLGLPTLSAASRIIEAAIAWRHGSVRPARQILAPLLRVRDADRLPVHLIAAECLFSAAGGSIARRRAASLARRAPQVAAAELTAQLLALLAIGDPARRGALLRRFRRLRLPAAGPERSRRREFLSLEEAAHALQARTSK